MAHLSVVDIARTEAEARARALTSDGGGARRQHQAPSSLYRLFFREFFPNVRRLIYLDTDVIVQVDIAKLMSVTAIHPIVAVRSANRLHDRLNMCCNGVEKIRALAKETQDTFYELPDESYQELNNGVVIMDLPQLGPFFEKVFQWLEVNAKHHLFNNDQHAWNLAGAKMWSPLPKWAVVAAPDGLWREAVQHKEPREWLRQQLKATPLIHYANNPKPWNVRSTETLIYDEGIWESHAEGDRTLLTDPLFEVFQVDGYQVPLSHGGSVEPGDEYDAGRSVEQRTAKMKVCWRLAQARVASSQEHQTLRQVRGLSPEEYFALKGIGLVASCNAFLSEADIEHVDSLPPSALDEIFGQAAPPLSQKQMQVLQAAAEPLEEQRRAKTYLEELAALPPPPTNRELMVAVIAFVVLCLSFASLFHRVSIASKGPGTGRKKANGPKMGMKMIKRH